VLVKRLLTSIVILTMTHFLTAGTISGTIRDGNSGLPIADATITAFGNTLPDTFRVVSAMDGGYALENLPEQIYTITASASGYSDSMITPFYVPEAINYVNINFALRPLSGGIDFSFSGIVFDAQTGVPLADATVIVQSTAPFAQPYFTAETNAGGNFIIADLDAGEYDVWAQASGYEDLWFGAYTLSVEQQNRSLQIGLQPLGQTGNLISGSVSDSENGEPLVSALVHLQSTTFLMQDFSNLIGAWALTSVPSGQYYIKAEKAGYYDYYAPDGLTIDENTRISNMNLDMIPLSGTENASLSGFVFTNTVPAVPVFPATLTLLAEDEVYLQVRTGFDGTYNIPAFTSGTYTIRVEASGYIPQIVSDVALAAGSNLFEFALDADLSDGAGNIRGNATYSALGIPVVAATIEAQSSGGTSLFAITDYQGNYSLDVPSGTYIMSLRIIRDNGDFYQLYFPQTTEITEASALTISAGDSLTGIDFELPADIDPPAAGAFFGGVFAGEDDQSVLFPIYPAQVEMVIPNPLGSDTLTYSAMTNQGGSFNIPNILPGLYDITVRAPGYVDVFLNDYPVPPGGTGYDFVLQRDLPADAGSVSGSVAFLGSGTPAIGTALSFMAENGDHFFAYANTEGIYSIELPAGNYIARARYFEFPDYEYSVYYPGVFAPAEAALIAVQANASISGINFNVAGATAPESVTFRGQITSINGEPLADASIHLWLGDGADTLMATATSGGDGRYELSLQNGLAPFNIFYLSAGKSGLKTTWWPNQPSFYVAEPIYVISDTLITGLDIRLAPASGNTGSISGVVYDDSTGVPLANAWVSALATLSGEVVSTNTDMNGRYELNNLSGEPTLILFSAEAYMSEYYDNSGTWEEADVLFPDLIITGVNAGLASVPVGMPGTSIAGTVVAMDNGAPLAMTMVTVLDAAGNPLGFDVTNSDGHYHIEGLSLGELTLRLSKAGYQSQEMLLNFDPFQRPAIMQDAELTESAPTSVGSDNTKLAQRFELLPNYPNPFNPTTSIAFDLPESGVVNLKIYDTTGRLIATLIENQVQAAGRNQVVWNGRNSNGNTVGSGVYYYRIQYKSGNRELSAARKMIFFK
jgi:hypothetical protein